MDTIISFKDFSFTYRSQKSPTLHDINLDIFPGEKVLIVGPSGSGKSTLAHLINGLVPFAYEGKIEGSYTIGGKNPRDLGIFGLSNIVGTVLQDTDGQFVGLTVGEDVAFSLENNLVPLDDMNIKVDKVCKDVDITELKGHAPTALSGGQKQRVSMAGVLVSDVDILLFDEPLANLDPATGKRTIALIDSLNKEKKITCLIIEHRIEDALYKDVDRIILIDEGTIKADLTPDEMLSSDYLINAGIREPLYISALKAAGCEITTESKPANVDTMDLSEYEDNIKSFYQSTHDKKSSISGNEILKVSNLEFSYDSGKTVLSDINFTVYEKEMMSIVGKNGAGKSTLSSLICGFINPSNGSIHYRGEDISKYSIKERGERIGFVMQNPNHMISKPFVLEEVALGLKIRGVDEATIKSKCEEVLKICELWPYRNWPINALSYGMKKRVTIASILTMNPEVLILDEPTAGQDYRRYTEIMEFLKKLNLEHGITIIMITHDMHLMLEYTDRALVLADGKMVADATPAEVLTNSEITEKAYLKMTSLSNLCTRVGISDSIGFSNRFIQYEEENK
ncbi:MAG: ABC transporter ATP-binding protein [Lachnospiraceae bacterium]|nr:ABC transporter ATP-binding protein [Lachnospiraceae bacterium]